MKELTLPPDALFDDALIKEYLHDNPDFFERHPELLTTLRIAHGEQGTVSLVERRQQLLRTKVNQLEEEITRLMSIASRNERIYHRLNELCFGLLSCQDIGEVRQLLASHLRQQFGFSHVRLISVQDDEGELARILRTRLVHGHYFGRLTQSESKRLFGSEVGSVSLSLLSAESGRTIFAVASPDAMHFHPDMDHLLLDQLVRLLDHLLPRL
ncbi:DUF484 family protein [Shewanella sp. NIFS-20-20]|uniref:DUF484 family protein n=1 Tax=Shewanella sp. NIFS-20-20 TaxID=2853806 RepID=UPI001C442321|nr:DUF484 family protein [Shewanella sp. NIFS-20-20]MBV7317263.1 DUF484 family protein [Shewanella sp. NIFS-20-20]